MTDELNPPIAEAPAVAVQNGDATDEQVRRRRKWLGRYGGWIVFAVIAVLWAYLLFVQLLVWHYRAELPLVFALGGFAVAGLFIYQMCYRLTPADGIQPRFLLFAFAGGGLVAYILSRLLEPAFDVAFGGTPEHAPLAYTWLATPTEELCKIAVVIVLARWIAVKNARNGLFVGGAVGFGFASYENIEKAFAILLNSGAAFPSSDLAYVHQGAVFSHAISLLVFNAVVRGLLTPFGHPIWTALIAAAVFAAYRHNRLRVTPAVVVVFVAVAAVHALWDFLPQLFNQLFAGDAGSAVLLAYVVYIVFGVAGAIVWNVVRKRANRSAAAELLSALAPPGELSPLS